MHRRADLALIVLLAPLFAGCAHFECTAHGGREVRELKSEHFVVTSDLPPDEHREETERLELLWDTFAQFFGANVAQAAVPVVVLSDASDVDAFAPGYGGYVRRGDARVLVVGSKVKPKAPNTNAHELTHLVSAYIMPRQPRWVAEGLGAYFEDASFVDARMVKMGNWNRLRAEEAFVTGVASLDELAAWGGPSRSAREERLYASAWAWIHYLANQDEARLKRLFEGLRGTRPPAQVVRDVFPPDDAARLQQAITAYVADARFRGWQTWLQRTPVLSPPRVLAPWEVHLLRSRMYLLDEPDKERREVEAAVALAPTPLPPVVAVAEAQAKKADLGPLLAAHPDAPEVLLAAHQAGKPVASAVLGKAAQASDDPELLRAAAQELVEVDLARAEALTARGLTLAPWSVGLVGVQLQLDLHRSRCAEAELDLARIESLLADRGSGRNGKYLEAMRKAVAACPAQR